MLALISATNAKHKINGWNWGKTKNVLMLIDCSTISGKILTRNPEKMLGMEKYFFGIYI